MIVSSVKNAGQNDLFAPRFAQAMAWIRATDLESLAPGRYPICGDEVFANVQEVRTVPPSQKSFEAHRRYADIHYVICGEEVVETAPVDACAPLSPFDPNADSGAFDGAATARVALGPGDFAVTPPCDAHKPGCCGPAGPGPLKKACIKVLVNSGNGDGHDAQD